MRRIFLTQQKIALIDDEDYGLVSQFKWRTQRIAVKGTIYGYYAITGQRKEATLMHRLILGLDREDKGYVDHIDGEGLNNQKENLRITTRNGNMQNSRKRKEMTSRFKGVYWSDGKWSATITKDGTQTYLGRFDNELEAAAVYNLAASILHREFAKLNDLGD